MAASVLWKELSPAQTEELIRSLEVGEGRNFLASALQLDTATPRGAIESDLYYYAVHFCRNCKFSADKTNALLGIIRAVHTESMKQFWPLDRSMGFFKVWL